MNETANKQAYDPHNTVLTPFFSAVPAFIDGSDSPRTYLERGLEVLEAREAGIKAFVHTDLAGARKAADAASVRYKAGKPASVLDGMPLGVKDVIETEDLPTEHGSAIFAGHRPDWDAPAVYWLRQAGAVVVGKTVTTEFATRPPGPTRNPWDLERTPGGSSSGSAAAVGAGMLPVGLGTQVRGSVLRPAAYCGLYALKPSYGVITLDGMHPNSRCLNHLGALAASLEDAWLTLHLTSRLAGGESNYLPLPGATAMPAPARPQRLVRFETAGWAGTPDAVKVPLEDLLARLAADGIEIIGRADDPEVDRVEGMMTETDEISGTLTAWESRYPLLAYAEKYPDKLSDFAHAGLAEKRTMDAETYAIAQQRAQAFRAAYASLAGKADLGITLTASGAAPLGLETGPVTFCDPFSLLHVPAITLPVFAMNDLPLGAQLAGFKGRDRDLVAHAAWIRDFALKR
jgi:Asp-tRNA(Asn)/Glu-tRNA(Gln) amidotransferase A subunit family amidase